MWLESGGRPVDDQLGTNQQLTGDCFWSICLWSQKGVRLSGDLSATDWQLISAQSATTICAGIVCDHCDRPFANRSPTSSQPCHHQKPLYDQFSHTEASLAACKTSLQPKSLLRPSCDLCKLSVTSPWLALAIPLQPPWDCLKWGSKVITDSLQAMCDCGLQSFDCCWEMNDFYYRLWWAKKIAYNEQICIWIIHWSKGILIPAVPLSLVATPTCFSIQ